MLFASKCIYLFFDLSRKNSGLQDGAAMHTLFCTVAISICGEKIKTSKQQLSWFCLEATPLLRLAAGQSDLAHLDF